MPARPFSFVHASDLRLEQAPYGVALLADEFRPTLLAAAQKAATRIFDLVLAEQADFLVLAGDVVEPWSAGPHGPLFLAQQCQRLAQAGIEIYWAGGRVDPPDGWPAGIRLPANVHRFPAGHVESLTCQRDGRLIARLVGQSHEPGQDFRPADFRADPSGLFTIAVAHTKVDGVALAASDCHYWALGGRHAAGVSTRTTGTSEVGEGARQVAHYPGTHQGRQPGESGPHGATLVRVDSEGRIRLVPKSTDVVRWHEERIALGPGAGRANLEAALRERLRSLEAGNEVDLLLVTWTVAGPAQLTSLLRRGTMTAELLEALHRDSRHAERTIASVALRPEAPTELPAALLAEESLAGDFLRAVEALRKDPSPLDLSTCVDRLGADDPLRGIAQLHDPSHRQRVLNEVAALGTELLTGEGTLS